jgi:hypothetical protein
MKCGSAIRRGKHCDNEGCLRLWCALEKQSVQQQQDHCAND